MVDIKLEAAAATVAELAVVAGLLKMVSLVTWLPSIRRPATPFLGMVARSLLTRRQRVGSF